MGHAPLTLSVSPLCPPGHPRHCLCHPRHCLFHPRHCLFHPRGWSPRHRGLDQPDRAQEHTAELNRIAERMNQKSAPLVLPRPRHLRSSSHAAALFVVVLLPPPSVPRPLSPALLQEEACAPQSCQRAFRRPSPPPVGLNGGLELGLRRRGHVRERPMRGWPVGWPSAGSPR